MQAAPSTPAPAQAPMIRKNLSIPDLTAKQPPLCFINQLDRDDDKQDPPRRVPLQEQKSLMEEKKNILSRNDLFEKKKQLMKNQSEIISQHSHLHKQPQHPPPEKNHKRAHSLYFSRNNHLRLNKQSSTQCFAKPGSQPTVHSHSSYLPTHPRQHSFLDHIEQQLRYFQQDQPPPKQSIPSKQTIHSHPATTRTNPSEDNTKNLFIQIQILKKEIQRRNQLISELQNQAQQQELKIESQRQTLDDQNEKQTQYMHHLLQKDNQILKLKGKLNNYKKLCSQQSSQKENEKSSLQQRLQMQMVEKDLLLPKNNVFCQGGNSTTRVAPFQPALNKQLKRNAMPGQFLKQDYDLHGYEQQLLQFSNHDFSSCQLSYTTKTLHNDSDCECNYE